MSARYNVRDASGALVAVHVREDSPEGKRLWWVRPDGTLGLDGLPVTALPLYGSEEVAGWPLSETIVVTEGEKAMEALCGVGVAVLATVTGAAVTPTVEALTPIAVGRTFVLWPDHDAPGRAHMARLAQALHKAGARGVYVVDTTSLDWPQGTDAADFVEHHPDITEFISKYAKAVPRESKPPLRLVVRGESNTQHGLDAASLSARLDRVRATSTGRFKARCPAHEDKVASLTFCDGDDGRLLVFCHAGCTFEQVMGALA